MKNIIIIFILIQVNGKVFSQITFSPHVEIQNAGIRSFCIAEDFNNDGLTDLVTASESGFVYLLWIYKQQNGQLIFQDTIEYNGLGYCGVQSIASGDLNNDELTDLIISYCDSVKIYFQDSILGFFNASESITFRVDSTTGGIHGLAGGDLNNDGFCDLAVSSWNNSSIYVYYQNSNHTFLLRTYYKRNTQDNELLISDINNDGLNDLIVSNGGTYGAFDNDGNKNCFAIYLQDSISHYLQFPHFFAVDTITPNSWIKNTVLGIAIGDIDNDGYKDIVTSYIFYAYIWHQEPGNPTLFPNPPDSLGSDINPSPVYIKDLNNDGKNEIIICSDGYERVSVFESDSNFQFSNFTLVSLWNTSNMEQGMMSVEDLNNDSMLDIVTTYGYGASIAYNITLSSVDDIFKNTNQDMIIYPNPSKDIFKIMLNAEILQAQLEIYNAFGEKIYTTTIHQRKETINTRGLPSGIYFVKVSEDGRQYCKELIIAQD